MSKKKKVSGFCRTHRKVATNSFSISQADRCGRQKDLVFGISLPFGRLQLFLRISMAVWFLGAIQLDLIWATYFDDCTVDSCFLKLEHQQGS